MSRLQRCGRRGDRRPGRVSDYAVRLVLATRKPDRARAGQHRRPAGLRRQPSGQHRPRPRRRALALLRGRAHALPQDVYDVAFDVLNHRLVPSFDAVADGVTVDDIVVEVLSTVKAPRRLTCRAGREPPARPHDLAHRGVARRGGRSGADRPAPPRRPAAGRPRRAPARATAARPGEARLYEPGDDTRRLDWALTARTTTPHVRDTIADHELELWLVVDDSASLAFGTAALREARRGVGRGRRLRAAGLPRWQPGRRADDHRPAGARFPARERPRTTSAPSSPPCAAARGRRRRGDLAAALGHAAPARPPPRPGGRGVRLPRARRLGEPAAGPRQQARRRRRRGDRPSRAGPARRRPAGGGRPRDRAPADRRHR